MGNKYLERLPRFTLGDKGVKRYVIAAMSPLHRFNLLMTRLFGALLVLAFQASAEAQVVGGNNWQTGLQNGLGYITWFAFLGGCVMVIAGFLNARRDENWKMTVIYGVGVAGAIPFMQLLYQVFGLAQGALTPQWQG
jgi:hypothetical protein